MLGRVMVSWMMGWDSQGKQVVVLGMFGSHGGIAGRVGSWCGGLTIVVAWTDVNFTTLAEEETGP